MASLDSVRQKLWRVKHHFEELREELVSYYKKIEQEGTLRIALEGNVVPARFGLICGDCLQCLRSSLDYLIWELVLASGKNPGQMNMFPSYSGWSRKGHGNHYLS